jgi:hypothetical protein
MCDQAGRRTLMQMVFSGQQDSAQAAAGAPSPDDPNLGSYPQPAELWPTRFGRFVPVAGLDGQLPAVEATTEAEEPPSRPGRLAYRLRRIVLGPPLDASAIAVERMRKLVALPVLSADALSSVAYGPEAMLAVLAPWRCSPSSQPG